MTFSVLKFPAFSVSVLLAVSVLQACAPGKTVDALAQACSTGDNPLKDRQVVSLGRVSDLGHPPAWQELPRPSRGKFGSDVRVSYKMDPKTAKEPGTWQAQPQTTRTVHLRFSSVVADPAAAYVYTIDGAALVDHAKSLFMLEIGQTNEVSVRIDPAAGKGLLAVVTCQNGRQSIMSIDVPA